MAKTKARTGNEEFMLTEGDDDRPAVLPQEKNWDALEAAGQVTKKADAPAGKPLARFRVELVCPTPLLHRSLEVMAADAEHARRLFCEANGISDSSHTWNVEQVHAGEAELVGQQRAQHQQ